MFEAVARLLWAERKVAKAREWFERGVRVGGDYGDVWVWWYRMETEAEGEGREGKAGGGRAEEVMRRCVERDPSHGELWTSVSKDDRFVSAKTADILRLASRNIQEIVPGERLLSLNGTTGSKVKKEVDATTATNGTVAGLLNT